MKQHKELTNSVNNENPNGQDEEILFRQIESTISDDETLDENTLQNPQETKNENYNNDNNNVKKNNENSYTTNFISLINTSIFSQNIKRVVNDVVRHNGFFALIFTSLAIVLLMSLVSYSPLDSSFNVVSNKKTLNYMGMFGAYTSDILFQYIGLASFAIPVWCIVMAIHLFNHVRIFILMRTLFFTSALLNLSFLLCYFRSYKYFFEYILGGYLMNNLIFEQIQSPATKLYSFLLSAIVMIFCSLVSFGIFPIRQYFLFIEELIVKFLTFLSFGHLDFKKQNFVKVKPHRRLSKRSTYNKMEDDENYGYHYNEEENDDQNQYLSLNEKNTENTNITKTNNVNSGQRNVKPKRLFSNAAKNIKYNPPLVDFLSNTLQSQILKTQQNIQSAKHLKDMLINCLSDFGVTGSIKSIQVGPVISLFEFEPSAGIRAARIIGLSDDIARYIKTSSCRISLISAKGTLGIEIPNTQRETVFLREVIESDDYKQSKALLPITFGKTIYGDIFMADLAKMPHLLIAGTTGSGKSVGVNAIILSLLYSLSPQQCRFIMIDPKMLELSVYDGIPHLLSPVITDAKNAVLALRWILEEMERRYTSMAKVGVRNIIGFNEKAKENDLEKLPLIVVIVDEMADLMVVSGKAVEISIQRISQMARAAGIHLILATQRPSVDVITGVIKANMPTRVSFQVTSSIDSRTIIGTQGAEKLLGMGDMIFVPAGIQMMRMHAPFVSDGEVAKIVNYLKQNNPETKKIDFFASQIPSNDEDYDDSSSSKTYNSSNSSGEYEGYRGQVGSYAIEDESSQGSFKFVDNNEFNKLLGIDDENKKNSDKQLYDAAIKIVCEEKRTSISYIQRKLRIGFNKAASIVEQMEYDGLLSKPDDKGKRTINENFAKKQ